MRFNLDKNGIKKFKGVLEKRLKEVENKSMEYLWKELYTLTPKDTGAARSSWNISINTPNYEFDPSKTNTSISIPQSKINDTLVLATGCPYMSVLNNRLVSTSTQKLYTNFNFKYKKIYKHFIS